MMAAGDVHSPWRRCSLLDGVVGGVGVDEDDAACLVSCCGVAERVGVERAEDDGRPSSMPERLYTRQREISVCKFDHGQESRNTQIRETEIKDGAHDVPREIPFGSD